MNTPNSDNVTDDGDNRCDERPDVAATVATDTMRHHVWSYLTKQQ